MIQVAILRTWFTATGVDKLLEFLTDTLANYSIEKVKIQYVASNHDDSLIVIVLLEDDRT